MKKKFKSWDELIGVWADQSQPEGDCCLSKGLYGGSVCRAFFRGPSLYSYGLHWCIARFVSNDKGERACLLNVNDERRTTNAQRQCARCALQRRGIKIIPTRDMDTIAADGASSYRHAIAMEITSILLTDQRILRKGSRKQADVFNRALRLAGQFNDRREFFGWDVQTIELASEFPAAWGFARMLGWVESSRLEKV